MQNHFSTRHSFEEMWQIWINPNAQQDEIWRSEPPVSFLGGVDSTNSVKTAMIVFLNRVARVRIYKIAPPAITFVSSCSQLPRHWIEELPSQCMHWTYVVFRQSNSFAEGLSKLSRYALKSYGALYLVGSQCYHSDSKMLKHVSANCVFCDLAVLRVEHVAIVFDCYSLARP